jgi:hypothetical protein
VTPEGIEETIVLIREADREAQILGETGTLRVPADDEAFFEEASGDLPGLFADVAEEEVGIRREHRHPQFVESRGKSDSFPDEPFNPTEHPVRLFECVHRQFHGKR